MDIPHFVYSPVGGIDISLHLKENERVFTLDLNMSDAELGTQIGVSRYHILTW